MRSLLSLLIVLFAVPGWREHLNNEQPAPTSESSSPVDFRLTLSVNSAAITRDANPLNESTEFVFDFQVTETQDGDSFQLRRHRISVNHLSRTVTREFSSRSVSEIKEGETATQRFDEVAPSLRAVLVDLFDYPLFSRINSVDGSRKLVNSTRANAQTEIERGTPLLLSFAPLSHQETRIAARGSQWRK